MATPPISKAQARQTVSVYEQCLADGYRHTGTPSATQEAARRLSINSATVRSRLRRIKEIYGLEPDIPAQVFKRPNPGIDAATAERLRARDEISGLRARLNEAHREINELQDIRRAAFHLAAEPMNPPRWTLRKSASKGGVETPVLFTSDFQWGEVIRPDEVDGLNVFNTEVAQQRYRLLIEKTIDLCLNHTVKPNYPGIIYLRGGDALSGGIHDELAETDDLKPIPAVRDLAAQEIWGIEALAEAFGKVHVISVPGNHGRTHHKPRQKQYVDTNYEDLLAWAMELHFQARGDKRVTFCTPRSGDAYFQVGKTHFLMTHGDRIGSGGGTGFIGPAATIMKGIYKIRQQYHRIGKPVDYVLMGHYHTAMMVPHGIANGSLSGFGEYAGKKLRVEPEPACQWLFHVHSDVGITQARQIYLSELGGHG